MDIDENWAVSLERIHHFFSEQEDVSCDIDGLYHYKNCIITLERKLPTLNKPMSIARTRLIIDGPDEEVTVIHRRFFLRFLSAGG